MNKFRHRLKTLRLKKNLSQEELAHQAGLKLSNLAKLEGGFNNNPTYKTLMSIALVLTKGSIDKLLVTSNQKKIIPLESIKDRQNK